MVNWETTILGSVGDFSKGRGINKDEAHSGNIPCVRYGEIYTHHNDYVKTFHSHISETVADASRRLRTGELLFAGSGETKEDIGKCVAFVDDCEAYAGGDIVILTPRKAVDSLFLGYYLNSKPIAEQKASRGQGDAIVHISARSLAEIEVQLPPLPEQRRIAEALSDTDALLAATEKLIAKKRAIKQGVMQELLTGKRKLPGFEGEWVKTTLSELLQYEQPQKYIVASTKYEESGTPVLTAGKSLVLGYTNERDGIYTNLPVIIFDDFTTESKYITYPFKVKSSAMKLLTSTGICDIRLIYALMQTINFPLKDHQRYWISEYSKLEVKIPPTIAEQTAIAEILSDMDAEIDVLTAKLNKLQNIKQGMMSELLAGRIRLVESEPIKATADIDQEKKTEPLRPVAKETKFKGHNQQFDDAVMIAGIVDALYSDKYPLGRKKVQKCLYLLRRYQGESTAAFKKKAAGPYADEVRYKGGEMIAKNMNYIATFNKKQGTTFARGKNISKALAYVQSWDRQADIKWVADKLKYKSVNKLELLATVDIATCDLMEAGTPVSVQSVKHLIATDVEWKEKLKKQNFSDANIARALRELNTLLQGGS